MKKAQLTIYMILGLALVILLLISVSIMGYTVLTPQTSLNLDKSTVSQYMKACIEDVSAEGLMIIGKRGGYLNPEQYIETGDDMIGFLNSSAMPTERTVEQDLSDYISENIEDNCLKMFKVFKETGWKISHGKINVDVQLTKQSVNIIVNSPITVKKKDKELTIDNFYITHKVRLLYILDSVKNILSSYESNKRWIDIDMIAYYNYNLTIFPYKDRLIFSIKDHKSQLKGKDYTFRFAAGY